MSGYGSNSILQGDTVELEGKLKPAYGTYAAKMSYAQMTVLEHHPDVIAIVKRNFANGMRNALPEPAASFAMGILIGQRINLSEEVKQDLLMVGLTHIIAVSGYNLTIILRASKGLLSKQSKRLSLFLSISLILVFLLITGSSASIVRAAIVSIFLSADCQRHFLVEHIFVHAKPILDNSTTPQPQTKRQNKNQA